ncbi:MAG: hypothetical protein AB7O44_26490 [Hyphomicrobiaceae bacterium]
MIGDLPILSAGDSLARAQLEIDTPAGLPDRIIPFRFNPTEYQLQKANEFAEIAIPGLETPPVQYVRGGSERLSVEVLLDTSDTLDDVRAKYVDRLQSLMRISSELHAPPIVKFVWDKEIFRGVLDSLSVSYLLFAPSGVPLRARASISILAYRPVEVQVRQTKKSSPDTEKSVVARRGDRLDGIASAVFRDPARWRDIARVNDIRDPRRLEPGRLLLLPRIPTGGGRA